MRFAVIVKTSRTRKRASCGRKAHCHHDAEIEARQFFRAGGLRSQRTVEERFKRHRSRVRESLNKSVGIVV